VNLINPRNPNLIHSRSSLKTRILIPLCWPIEPSIPDVDDACSHVHVDPYQLTILVSYSALEFPLSIVNSDKIQSFKSRSIYRILSTGMENDKTRSLPWTQVMNLTAICTWQLLLTVI
jgi:hypothetical protein